MKDVIAWHQWLQKENLIRDIGFETNNKKFSLINYAIKLDKCFKNIKMVIDFINFTK